MKSARIAGMEIQEGNHGIFPLEVSKESGKFTDYDLMAALPMVLPFGLPVFDLGCALGYYAKGLAEHGYEVIAMDGTPGIHVIAVFHDIALCDLSQPLTLPVEDHSASILCLEVGEHIPAEFQETFLDNIARPARRLVLSWAVPGQGGHGHVNEQPNEWVRQKLLDRGLAFNFPATGFLRSVVGSTCAYFRNTLMVFDWPGAKR